MPHWKQATDILAPLARTPHFGLFSDLDGTLAPIAISPQAAQLSPRGRQFLTALREALPLLVLISGRRVANLVKKVDVPGLVYIGNHGLEHWEDGQTAGVSEPAPHL